MLMCKVALCVFFLSAHVQTEPLGRQMAEFPTEPRLAAMLLASLKYKCSEEMLTIAACSSVESLFFTGRDSRKKVGCFGASVTICLRLLYFSVLAPNPSCIPLMGASPPPIRHIPVLQLDAGLQEVAVKQGDHLTFLNLYNSFLDNKKSPTWCSQRGFNYRALCRVSEIR
jgi:ATP-dependent RNA helicase DDX35